MATDALSGAERGWFGRLVDFFRDVQGEVKKVTWPSTEELRRATIVIVIFVGLLGVLIGLMDVFLQFVLVTEIPRLF